MKTINETIARMISDEAISVKKIDKTSKKLSKKKLLVCLVWPRVTDCKESSKSYDDRLIILRVLAKKPDLEDVTTEL